MAKYIKKDAVQDNIETKDNNTEVVESKDAIKSSAEIENEQLKEQLAKMQAQMDLMMKAMNSSVQSTTIKDDRNITFINLHTGSIVMKGTRGYHTLAGQFAKQAFPKHEAQSILMNTPNLVTSGSVYIADADFIKENELDYVFKNMLNDTQLKNLLNQNPQEVIEIYKTVPDSQKDIIINMIIEKKSHGQYVDANILLELGILSNRNLIEIESVEEK